MGRASILLLPAAWDALVIGRPSALQAPLRAEHRERGPVLEPTGGQWRRGVRGQTTLLAAAGLTVSARLGRAPATESRCAHRRPRPAAASPQPHLVPWLPQCALDAAPALLLQFWDMAAVQGASRRWTPVRVMKGSGLGCSLHAGAPGPSAAYPDYPHCMNEHFDGRFCEGEPGMHAPSHARFCLGSL